MNRITPWIISLELILAAGIRLTARADYTPGPINLKAQETPAELKDIGITEQLGKQIDFSTEFVDEAGQKINLGNYFSKGHPVILSLVYYGCANLCNYHINGLVEGLKGIRENVGKDFELVALSIDEKETPKLASEKKQSYLRALGKPQAAEGWHFLTGSKASIDKLAGQVGFKFRWNEESKQWAHSSAAILINPDGKISRYLHGVLFEPKTLSLAITESSNFKVSNIINTFVLYCFKYDPRRSAYTLYASNVMKLGGLIAMGILFFILIRFWIRQRNLVMNQGES